jgi:hypothetical protein
MGAGTRLEQIVDSLGSPTITLGAAHLETLDEVSRVDMGFPHDFLAADAVRDLVQSELRTQLDGRPKPG